MNTDHIKISAYSSGKYDILHIVYQMAHYMSCVLCERKTMVQSNYKCRQMQCLVQKCLANRIFLWPVGWALLMGHLQHTIISCLITQYKW
jgi:hypothetical protein